MKINVYIGYDKRQDKSDKFSDLINPPYQIAKHSILKNYKGDENDLVIQPIKLQDMIDNGLYWRKEDKLASTEFTYSRFLTPHLNNYDGIAIFCDSDFLWQCDIKELLEYYDEKYSVICVKHNYYPTQETKMDGKIQTIYPRKNWSSLMMFNCSHIDCQNLSLENVNTKSPKYLHRMNWTSDKNIGEIPPTYNWLEGWYDGSINPKVIHYTRGAPIHESWDGDYRINWIQHYEELI